LPFGQRTAAAGVKWCFLFLVPLIVRSAVWVAGSGMGFIGFDTLSYWGEGDAYVRGLLSGNLTSFSQGAWHPPLAKVLIGLVRLPFSDPKASSDAAMFLLCILSASICVTAYSLGNLIGGGTAGWLAWALVSLDPVMVAWTTAWIDTPMVLFTMLALYFLYRNDGKRSSMLSGFFIALALLCKYTAVPFFILVLILTRKPSSRLLLTVLTSLVVVALNPQLWVSEGRSVVTVSVTSGWGFLPYTVGFAMFAGPLAYPWAFLTALGRFPSYSFFEVVAASPASRQLIVVPSVAPLVVLGLLALLVFARRSLDLPRSEVPFIWLGSAVLTLALLPKSYPYYEVMLVPQAALCAATLLGWLQSRHPKLRFEGPWRGLSVAGNVLVVVGCVYVVLSPYAVLFRAIRGSSNPWVLVLLALSPGSIQGRLMPLESLVAFLFTAGLAVCSVFVAMRVSGVISGWKRSPDSAGVPTAVPSFSQLTRCFMSSSSEVAQDFLNATLKQGIENIWRRRGMSARTTERSGPDNHMNARDADSLRDGNAALCGLDK